MAIFQYSDKSLHYELHSGVLPEDTLFIHGNLASNRWWKPTFALLKDRYQGTEATGSMAAAEWLGCGDSSAPHSEAELDMFSLAKDFIHLIKGLGLSDVNLVGHSTGGLIALCALLTEPNLFSKIVLLDSVSAAGVQFGPEMYDAFTKMSQDRAFCDSIMASTIHNCNVQDPLVQELFNDAFNVDKMIWHGVANALKKIDIRKDLKKLNHPALILHGEFDTLLPIAGSKEIAASLGNGEFHEIKGQGHCCNMENPQKFVDLLCEFLFED